MKKQELIQQIKKTPVHRQPRYLTQMNKKELEDWLIDYKKVFYRGDKHE